jgi:hypothetical protein
MSGFTEMMEYFTNYQLLTINIHAALSAAALHILLFVGV